MDGKSYESLAEDGESSLIWIGNKKEGKQYLVQWALRIRSKHIITLRERYDENDCIYV